MTVLCNNIKTILIMLLKIVHKRKKSINLLNKFHTKFFSFFLHNIEITLIILTTVRNIINVIFHKGKKFVINSMKNFLVFFFAFYTSCEIYLRCTGIYNICRGCQKIICLSPLNRWRFVSKVGRKIDSQRQTFFHCTVFSSLSV